MRKNNGITLIALVVSIVVLLILAGVSINLVAGGDGIISKASKAVDETVKASMKEQIEMYVSEATYDYYLNNPDNKSYLEFMGEYLENNPNMRSNENVDIVVQDDAELILNYTQGKNLVQMSLSDDGIVDVVESGTTEGEFEDTYAPKVSYDASTTSSITVTLKDASGVVAYACLLENTKPEADSADWVTIAEAQTKQVAITGLTGNQTYYVFAKDKAGNISEGKVCKTIPYEEIKFTTEQSGSNFTVTVTSPTDTSNIVYQIGDDGTETQYIGAFLVPSGKTVFIWNVENKDATLKSKALFANVTVTYNANGGEGELPENVVTQHKQTVTVDTSKVLTKAGYTFLGWALTDDATARISTFEAPATNTTLYAVWESKNKTLAGLTTGYSYKNPVIPQGFKAIDTDTAKWTYTDSTTVSGWNSGLVIEDAVGANKNQFVWVPCINGTETSDLVSYSKNFSYPNNYSADSNNTSDDTSVYPVSDEMAQITKYGGFYVARYEAGYANASSSSTTPNNDGTIVPVSIAGTKILNNINYDNSAASAKLMVNDSSKYGNNKSGLITGTQWDTIMQWYTKTGTAVTEGHEWGTYYNIEYSVTGNYFIYNGNVDIWQNGSYTHTKDSTSPDVFHGSGLNSNGIKNNIADMGGNVWEWTSEINFEQHITRGSSANFNSGMPISFRNNAVTNSFTYFDLGFRAVLYVQ